MSFSTFDFAELLEINGPIRLAGKTADADLLL
jgi:hypothetical protein